MGRLLWMALVVLVMLGPMGLRASAQSQECLTIDDFSRSTVGAFPTDWKPRADAAKDVYKVLEESGRRFLRAVSKGLGIQAVRQFDWDLAKYPVMSWMWRPGEFPRGADERNSGANDSVLAVYVLVPYSRIAGPKAVKYIWSERVPVGTHLTSNMGLTQVKVLRTGPTGVSEWTEEHVNLLEDYRKYFGDSETPKPGGIAVLTDSDDTRSSAQGDYTKFRVCRG